MKRLDVTGYQTPIQYQAGLLAELTDVVVRHGDLVLATGPEQVSRWATNVWQEVHEISALSIKDAARQLRDVQRNWWPYSHAFHRRTALIQQALPHVKARPLRFPEPAPTAPLGAFTLLDEQRILCSPKCSSPFPNGEANFIEFKETEGPPSRAYLKLFEALTRLGVYPKPGERCLELGASPGGWTWVLATLGAEVLAIDRSPLAENVARMPQVTTQLGNAFSATPKSIGRIDWLFSDVICYPEKLWEHVSLWLESGLCERFVCTLKFQGNDYSAVKLFERISGAHIVHLSHNRHELMFLRAPVSAPRASAAS